MLKQKPRFERLLFTICLTVIILILLGSLTSVGAVEHATYYPRAHNVVNGTYLSGSLPSSLQDIDSDYFTVASSPLATSASTYNPSGYNLPGATYVLGSAEDLVSNNDVYLVYGSLSSAASTQSLYAHQEATTIGGNPYSFQKPESADLAGTSLTAPMYPTGRNLLGRFIYPLTGISSIPTSTWTEFYRTWRDPDQGIDYDSASSGNNGGGTTSIAWTHVVGSGFNRFMVMGVSIRTVTVSVLSVTVGARSATLLRNDTGTGVRGEVWYLVNPDSGSQTVTVTLSDISRASGGSVSYTGVDQISPIDGTANVSYTGLSPSVSLTTTTANNWIFSNLAISGTYYVAVHGVGQTHRYSEIGTAGNRAGDDGDDIIAIAAGSYNMSWTMNSFFAEVVAQAVVIKPAPPPVGHIDIDISILKSDGTIRTSIASSVANSVADLTPTPMTLSGTYYWAAYAVVDQTDFLEIDYYLDVALGTSGVSAYLRIDDSALPLDDQTRTINVMLPYEQAVEVELTGTCNMYSWTQLQWAVDSTWTIDSAAVTMQLYNHTLGAYSTSGDGFVSYTSNATANTDEEKTQTVVVNPHDFRDPTGNWKVKVKGVKTISAPFDFKADWVELRPTYYSEYTVSTEFQFSSMTITTPIQLNFSLVNEYDVAGASVTIQVWNYSSSEYAVDGQGYLRYTSLSSNETQRLSIDVNPQFYVSNGDAKIRITALLSTGTQYRQETNQASLVYVVAGAIQPFDWTLLLYVLPVPCVLFLIWFIVFRRRKKTSFAGKKTDLFSGQFGMNHQQMTGKKMLLEIDPTSDYILAFSGFVSEAKNNGESLFILTSEDSALHSVFSEDGKVNFLLLTSKTDSLQQINERVTLLPAGDLSGILKTLGRARAFNRIQEAASEENISLLFDNVSDVIAKCGFDETYEFTRLLLEEISSPKTTAVFAFIPTAHGQEVSSSIRGLFKDHFAYSSDGARTGSL